MNLTIHYPFIFFFRLNVHVHDKHEMKCVAKVVAFVKNKQISPSVSQFCKHYLTSNGRFPNFQTISSLPQSADKSMKHTRNITR